MTWSSSLMSAPPASDGEAALRQRAARLHRQAVVVDGHNDITSAMLDEGFELGQDGYGANAPIKTQTDLARMKAGGLNAEFFAIYVDARFLNRRPAEGGGAARRALDMIDVVLTQVRHHPKSMAMAYNVADIRRIKKQGKIAALMGIEGGHAIEDSLATLRVFYQLGARYMTLTHVNSNDWADSEADQDDPAVPHHQGLTDFGRKVVREMNRLGMMVDISHVADQTFFEVMRVTRAPVIASHSCARALANHPRNLSDEMLRALARNGGVVMVNFYDGFLNPQAAALDLQSRQAEKDLSRQFPNNSKRVSAEMKKWWAAHRSDKTPLAVLGDHLEHIIKVAGIDHVGLGSDFDGASGFPEGLEDVAKLPNLTFELVKRGYSDQDIKKVLGENLLRVMSETERIAAVMKKEK